MVIITLGITIFQNFVVLPKMKQIRKKNSLGKRERTNLTNSLIRIIAPATLVVT